MPSKRVFARSTIASAFQRIIRRIAELHRLVAGEVRLLLGRDRVDVAGLGQARQADLELARALEQLIQDEAGSLLARRLDHVLERVDPLLRLDRIDIGQLLLELVEDVVNRAASPYGTDRCRGRLRAMSRAERRAYKCITRGRTRTRRRTTGVARRASSARKRRRAAPLAPRAARPSFPRFLDNWAFGGAARRRPGRLSVAWPNGTPLPADVGRRRRPAAWGGACLRRSGRSPAGPLPGLGLPRTATPTVTGPRGGASSGLGY